MIICSLSMSPEEIRRHTGWAITHDGACRDDLCVLLPGIEARHDGTIDVGEFAAGMGMPIARDEKNGVWALGPRAGGKVLSTATSPEVVLENFDGSVFDLASLRGRKIVLITWASWCGCRFDLPAWQALHAELESAGLTIVTVALDTDVEAARPFHEASGPTHPSLVDPALSLVGLFGITNVPFGVWIDEGGSVVRPAEAAFVSREDGSEKGGEGSQRVQNPPDLSTKQREVMEGILRSLPDPDRYIAAVRDWAINGANSRFVLTPAEVVARSRSCPPEATMAAAEYELGQYLHRAGNRSDAISHFQEAHRLDPQNWTYVRNAFAIVDPKEMGNPYGTDLLSEVARVGTETFYPRPDI